MPEHAAAGEDHGHAVLVGGVDDLLVPDAASGLDDGCDPGVCRLVDAVPEGEERIGGHDAALRGLVRLHGRDLGGVHTAHLAGPDSDGALAAHVDDGVGGDVLGQLPCEEQGVDLLLRGGALGDDLQVLGVDDYVLVGLDQHPSLDLLHLVLPDPLGGADGTVGPEQADVLLDLHDLNRALLVIGADDGLDEVLGDLLGDLHRAGPVEADDAAEGGEGIDVVRRHERVVDVVGRGESTGVGVLHDDGCRPLEVHADVHCLVQIQDVVVGQLLAVLEVLRPGDRGAGCEGILVEGGLLVGVLAVPEVLDLLQGDGEALGEPCAEPLVHLGRDHAVVVGGVDEGLGHELAVELLGDLPLLLQLGDDLGVLGGLCDDCHGFVVLRRGADHAGAADVDVLHDLVECDAVLEDGLLEGVQVDNDHVDRLDALGGDGVHVLLDVPAGEDARVDHWVERLHASVQHLGEAGDLLDLLHRDAVLFQKFVRPAGGDDLHTHGGQLLREVDDAGFVRDTDDCSADL